MPEINISPAALEAGARAVKGVCVSSLAPTTYEELARAAFTAMVEAWEGMETSKPDPWSFPDRLILPLPQEKPDGE